MSRIVIERHGNGGEKIVAGYDHPLQTAFVDEYADSMYSDGETIDGIGPMWTNLPVSDEDVVRWLLHRGVAPAVAHQVGILIVQHMELEYPASNVVVDLTREEAQR